jgi:hypothetical protein
VWGDVLLGLLWLSAGLLVGNRWRHGRALHQTARDHPATRADRVRFGTVAEDGSGRRRQAMLLAYAAGLTTTGAGMASGVAVVLALGAALLNLGTIYRVLVIALDHDHLDVPVAELRLTAASPLPG